MPVYTEEIDLRADVLSTGGNFFDNAGLTVYFRAEATGSHLATCQVFRTNILGPLQKVYAYFSSGGDEYYEDYSLSDTVTFKVEWDDDLSEKRLYVNDVLINTTAMSGAVTAVSISIDGTVAAYAPGGSAALDGTVDNFTFTIDASLKWEDDFDLFTLDTSYNLSETAASTYWNVSGNLGAGNVGEITRSLSLPLEDLIGYHIHILRDMKTSRLWRAYAA